MIGAKAMPTLGCGHKGCPGNVVDVDNRRNPNFIMIVYIITAMLGSGNRSERTRKPYGPSALL